MKRKARALASGSDQHVARSKIFRGRPLTFDRMLKNDVKYRFMIDMAR
jgi:hypothetical protein